ncbi:MAG: hypothetical protein ACI89X_005177, partial [Planctomycetota bacterium]
GLCPPPLDGTWPEQLALAIAATHAMIK